MPSTEPLLIIFAEGSEGTVERTETAVSSWVETYIP